MSVSFVFKAYAGIQGIVHTWKKRITSTNFSRAIWGMIELYPEKHSAAVCKTLHHLANEDNLGPHFDRTISKRLHVHYKRRRNLFLIRDWRVEPNTQVEKYHTRLKELCGRYYKQNDQVMERQIRHFKQIWPKFVSYPNKNNSNNNLNRRWTSYKCTDIAATKAIAIFKIKNWRFWTFDIYLISLWNEISFVSTRSKYLFLL